MNCHKGRKRIICNEFSVRKCSFIMGVVECMIAVSSKIVIFSLVIEQKG